MLRLRGIVLEDDRMDETVTWKSATFMYRGNKAT